MNDVQVELEKLAAKRWTMAAVATELGINRVSVSRWRAGATYPSVPEPILVVLRTLLKRKKVPKMKRYSAGRSGGSGIRR